MPIWLKVFLLVFTCALASYNAIQHGIGSLLYFCNVALFLGAIGIWFERSYLVSMAAVGVVAIQLLWSADLILAASGTPLLGLTSYMLSENVPVLKKAFSYFHAWLPFVLLFAVWRLGYRPAAFWAWTALSSVLLVVSYLALPPPPAPVHDPDLAVNVNYVFGLYASGPQQRMPAWMWLAGMLVTLPAFLFYPTHFVLARFFPRSVEKRSASFQPVPCASEE